MWNYKNIVTWIKDKPTIRASSYNLFGELARFGQGPSKDPYLEQIHSNFVSFILHLNEQNDEVKRSCKNVLKHVGPLMESNLVNELFQASLVDGKSLHYGEFINDLSKLLVNLIMAYSRWLNFQLNSNFCCHL